MNQKSEIIISESDKNLDKIVFKGLTRQQIIEKAKSGEGLVSSFEERMKRFHKVKNHS